MDLRARLRSPVPALLALGLCLFLLAGSLACASLATPGTKADGGLGRTGDRVTYVLTVYEVDPGDVLQVPAPWGVSDFKGMGRFLVVQGGEGQAIKQGGTAPHVYLERPIQMSVLRWTRPAIPADAAGGQGLNGDLRTAVDLVWTLQRGDVPAEWGSWEKNAARFADGAYPFIFFSTDARVVLAQGPLLVASSVLQVGSFAAGAAFFALLAAHLALRPRPTPSAEAGLGSLVALAEEARRAVRGLRDTLRIVGALLLLGAASVPATVNAWTDAVRVDPWRGWDEQVFLLAIALPLGAGLLWWRQYVRIKRLHRAWSALPAPEV